MTLLFDEKAFESYVTDELVQQAMIAACEAEAQKVAHLPPRIDVPTPHGFLRVMPAWLDDVMGLKVMTLVEGLGTRYLVLLYATASGELLALFDADELTRVRTAGTTALAAQTMVARPPTSLGLVGTGFEARGHLLALAKLWPLKEVAVYSPAPSHKETFANQMSAQLGLPITAVASAEEAVRNQEVVVLATKSKHPVLNGEHVSPQCVVLSIGSTRPDLRELDITTLHRAAWVVGDDPAQLVSESGDIIAAIQAGELTTSRIIPLASARIGREQFQTEPGRDLLVFKSVGTALQDLALARALYQAARSNVKEGVITDVGDIPRLKPFAISRAKRQ